MANPETMPKQEIEEGITYEHELSQDNMSFTIKHDSEGRVTSLIVTDNESGNEVYNHDAKKHGPIDKEKLDKELTDIGLQRVSIVSVIEKIT